MYAECPNCHAIFRVTPEILAQAKGNVRCGECHTVFKAAVEPPGPIADVVEYAPDSGAVGQIPLEQPTGEPLDTDLEVDDVSRVEQALQEEFEDQSKQPDTAGLNLTELKTETRTEDHILPDQTPKPPAPVESLTHEKPQAELFAQTGVDEQLPAKPVDSAAMGSTEPTIARASKPGSGLWHNAEWLGLLSLILLLTLAGQYLYKNRYELSQIAGMRPTLETLCDVVGCDLPPRVALSKLELLNHGIYSHPNVKDALMIKAVIINHAAFTQPLPIIELSLSNIRGEKVALRRFSPSEYLPEGDELENGQMPIEKQINISLQVKDPGKDALAFEFEFL